MIKLKYELKPETKILIVDDIFTMRQIIRKILEDLGFLNVREADDGDTALPILDDEEFGLVISDWNMKRMQGIDLLRNIRSNEKTKHIPVMLVTAEIKKSQVIEAINAGANGYIAKPFTPETLRDKLNEMMARLNHSSKKS